TTLRVRLSPADAHGAVTVELADGRTGDAVGHIRSLRLRPAAPGTAREVVNTTDALFNVEWVAASDAAPAVDWVVVGNGQVPHAPATFPDLASLLAQRGQMPRVIVVPCVDAGTSERDLPTAARLAAHDVTRTLQELIADDRFAESRLVVLTRRAIAA